MSERVVDAWKLYVWHIKEPRPGYDWMGIFLDEERAKGWAEFLEAEDKEVGKCYEQPVVIEKCKLYIDKQGKYYEIMTESFTPSESQKI